MICIILLINLFTSDKEISQAERRKLTQKLEINKQLILGGNADILIEKYLLDQFFLRQEFRKVKAFVDLKILNKKDNNDIYVIDDNIFKMEYPLNEESVTDFADKINHIYNLYLKDCKVAYAIIPDKGYFVPKEYGYLGLDYLKIEDILNLEINGPKYIDLMGTLKLKDYYHTDIHWSQDGISKVIKIFGNHFGFDGNIDYSKFIKKSYAPFFGTYYGQAALSVRPDVLTYYTNNVIENAIATNYEQGNEADIIKVYNELKLGEIDSYDLFLSGNSPLIEIINPSNARGKELIIFRDSFASSLAPLLIEDYFKITLIDLRFVGYKNIGKYVDFKNQDVLFLYGAQILNESNLLREI